MATKLSATQIVSFMGNAGANRHGVLFKFDNGKHNGGIRRSFRVSPGVAQFLVKKPRSQFMFCKPCDHLAAAIMLEKALSLLRSSRLKFTAATAIDDKSAACESVHGLFAPLNSVVAMCDSAALVCPDRKKAAGAIKADAEKFLRVVGSAYAARYAEIYQFQME